MTPAQHYDAVVIGSGQGGNPLARALAHSGRTTALVEREHVGGTCINEGCTPTKTMIASARVAYLDRRSADYGIADGPVTVDMMRVRQRKREIVESFRDGGERRLEKAGVDLIRGEASFAGPKELEVRLSEGGASRLDADAVFINVGARPSDPPIEGLDGVPALNSTTVMELDEVPEHLLVLGGGYVGLEFAQMFRRFGSEVTIVQRGPQLLSREDADVAEAVAEVLREDGVEVLLGTRAERAGQAASGRIELAVRTPQGERELEGSHLLVAAGRTPNTDTLNLEAAGVETDEKGFITRKRAPRDQHRGHLGSRRRQGWRGFTHVSYHDFRVIKSNLLDGADAPPTGASFPTPSSRTRSSGGWALARRRRASRAATSIVARMPMSHVARAVEVDEERGMMKAVVDAWSGRILGAAVLGIEGGEVAAMLQIAMMGEVPYTMLRDGIFAHPPSPSPSTTCSPRSKA